MTDNDYYKLRAWLSVLRDVATEYSGRTLDNIIQNVEARVKDYEIRHKTKDNGREKQKGYPRGC